MTASEEWQMGTTGVSIFKWAVDRFASAGVDSPRLTAELLLCHAFGCARSQLRVRLDGAISPGERGRFRSYAKRRLEHEPLQYIVGSTEFMGLLFEVTTSTLIPRPETEVLTEKVIVHARSSKFASPRILDIGTGSGNIAVSLAHYLPGAQITAIDISGDALRVAARNVAAHGVGERVRLLELDCCAARQNFNEGEFDYVVSNPPYIAPWEFPRLPPEIREHEPMKALVGSSGGTWFYRPIAHAAQWILKPGGWLFLEVGFAQDEEISEIVREERFESVTRFRDYEGIFRIVGGQAPAG
jgi:release factor glutamine methyltransferase